MAAFAHPWKWSPKTPKSKLSHWDALGSFTSCRDCPLVSRPPRQALAPRMQSFPARQGKVVVY